MKVSKKKLILLQLAILLVCGVCYFQGYAWRLEWDTGSGKARTVYSVFGLDYSTSEERETVLSSWLGENPNEKNWVKVASGPAHFTLVSYTYVRVNQTIRSIGIEVEDEEARRDLAARILGMLAEEKSISEIREYCSKVEDGIRSADLDYFPFEEDELRKHLRKIYENPERSNFE